MKKLLLIVFLIFSTVIFAQDFHIGTRFSGIFSTMKYSADLAEVNNYSKGKFGFSLGLVTEIKLSDKFAVGPEISFASLGDKRQDSNDSFAFTTDYSTTYIQLSLLPRYYITENLYLNAGPQIGMLTSAKLKMTVTDEEGTRSETNDVKEGFNPIDYGVNVGGGFKLDSGLFFDVRYTAGLANISADFDKISNSVIQLGIGYFFN